MAYELADRIEGDTAIDTTKAGSPKRIRIKSEHGISDDENGLIIYWHIKWKLADYIARRETVVVYGRQDLD